jgi:hypothetical protein
MIQMDNIWTNSRTAKIYLYLCGEMYEYLNPPMRKSSGCQEDYENSEKVAAAKRIMKTAEKLAAANRVVKTTEK